MGRLARVFPVKQQNQKPAYGVPKKRSGEGEHQQLLRSAGWRRVESLGRWQVMELIVQVEGLGLERNLDMTIISFPPFKKKIHESVSSFHSHCVS